MKDERGKGGKFQALDIIKQRSVVLPFSKTKVSYDVDKGILYPILGAFRYLLTRDDAGVVKWKTDPFKFYTEHGTPIVRRVLSIISTEYKSANPAGKAKSLWEIAMSAVETEYSKIESQAKDAEIDYWRKKAQGKA